MAAPPIRGDERHPSARAERWRRLPEVLDVDRYLSHLVVELFTSQGCSSCPPADRLLTKLAQDPRYAGRVIPLSFHVDYWNYIGWTDPYSSRRWSERQRQYAAKAFRSDRIYGNEGAWYFAARGEPRIGPFASRDEAKQRVAMYFTNSSTTHA